MKQLIQTCFCNPCKGHTLAELLAQTKPIKALKPEKEPETKPEDKKMRLIGAPVLPGFEKF